MIPLSLYIHIPWCIKKCPYCDFNSHAINDKSLVEFEKFYIQALLDDLEHDLPLIWGRSVQTIFIGGGTPSLFSPVNIKNLISKIRSYVNLLPSAEITLELNPATIDQKNQDKLAGFYVAGINRLSIGVQSFNDKFLQNLGRVHNSDEAINTIENAKLAGFQNINLDIMFGLPTVQNIDEALSDLNIAVKLQPQHISWYQLTLEPNTNFYKNPPILPNDDTLWNMQTIGQTFLKQNNYSQYEISAYTKDSNHCQHNINYWQFGDYLGIGAGAHAKISNVVENTITRYSKHKMPKLYLNAVNKIDSTNILSANEIYLEFMLNALRLNSGFHKNLFHKRTNLKLDIINDKIDFLTAKKWLEIKQEFIRSTPLGRQFLDSLLEVFIE
jgi:oxygen-independent coproporphyrinogen-3 oxidase